MAVEKPGGSEAPSAAATSPDPSTSTDTAPAKTISTQTLSRRVQSRAPARPQVIGSWPYRESSTAPPLRLGKRDRAIANQTRHQQDSYDGWPNEEQRLGVAHRAYAFAWMRASPPPVATQLQRTRCGTGRWAGGVAYATLRRMSRLGLARIATTALWGACVVLFITGTPFRTLAWALPCRLRWRGRDLLRRGPRAAASPCRSYGGDPGAARHGRGHGRRRRCGDVLVVDWLTSG